MSRRDEPIPGRRRWEGLPLLPPRDGFFRRTIVTRATGDTVVSDIEDDFHRFGVTLRHVDGRVTDVQGRAIRYPWSTCPAAAHQLQRLVGMTITATPDEIYRHTDGRYQCTHMFELAGVAVTLAARRDRERIYEIVVSDPKDGRQRATLALDGEIILDWFVADETIESKDRFHRLTFRALGEWAARNADPLAEPALLLRRGARLSLGRRLDVDAIPTAAGLNRDGICFSFQPDTAQQGQRVKGSHRTFDAPVAAPLGDLLKTMHQAQIKEGNP